MIRLSFHFTWRVIVACNLILRGLRVFARSQPYRVRPVCLNQSIQIHPDRTPPYQSVTVAASGIDASCKNEVNRGRGGRTARGGQ